MYFLYFQPSLGVSACDEALLFIITGPVGPYYPTGFKPVSLLADPQYVRAWKGGSGGFKIGRSAKISNLCCIVRHVKYRSSVHVRMAG